MGYPPQADLCDIVEGDGGVDDDRNIVGGRMIAQRCEELESIGAREKEIQKEQVWTLFDNFLNPLRPIPGKNQRMGCAMADNST